jgi:hypothetical protein
VQFDSDAGKVAQEAPFPSKFSGAFSPLGDPWPLAISVHFAAICSGNDAGRMSPFWALDGTTGGTF